MVTRPQRRVWKEENMMRARSRKTMERELPVIMRFVRMESIALSGGTQVV